MRPIMATDSGGIVAASPNIEVPGPALRRLVPSSARSWLSWARLEVEMPTTAIIAAMPMAIPRAERTTRSGRARSP